MFSVIFRRSSFSVQKVLHCAAPPQSCWTSSLARSTDHRSHCPETSGASSAGRWRCEQAAAVPAFTRTEAFQSPRTRVSIFLLRDRHFHSSAVRQKNRLKPEPPPRELDLIRYDIKNLWNGPKPALYLGFVGMIPFVAPTLLMSTSETYLPELAHAQLAYSAAVVSFLGGARWGFALPEGSPATPDWINLANSVVPALVACGTMLISDTYVSAATMIIMGLGISLHYDLSLLPTYPSWFKALRTVLTFVAFFSLAGTLVMNGLYPEKKIFSD